MSLINDTASHELYLARLASGILNDKLYPAQESLYKQVRLLLLDAENITSRKQLASITKAVRKATEAAMAEAWAETTKELSEVAVYEAAFYAQLLGAYGAIELTVPKAKTITNYVDEALMSLQSGARSNVGTWSEFVANNVTSYANEYDNAIKAGYIQRESMSQTVKRVKAVTDGLLKREVETLTRTGMQHYTVQARQAMALDNLDIVDRELPLVVFDNRTSDKCLGISSEYGKKGWPIGESPKGYPPYHFNCRTSIIFLLKGQKELPSTRAAVGGRDTAEAKRLFEEKQARLAALRDKRAEERADGKATPETASQVRYKGKADANIFKPGQIDANIGVDTWLRDQPAYFIEDTLGKTKAKLFMSGEYKLERFVDAAGRSLSINELKARDADIFARLGL
jgi:hypothetical protein